MIEYLDSVENQLEKQFHMVDATLMSIVIEQRR